MCKPSDGPTVSLPCIFDGMQHKRILAALIGTVDRVAQDMQYSNDKTDSPLPLDSQSRAEPLVSNVSPNSHAGLGMPHDKVKEASSRGRRKNHHKVSASGADLPYESTLKGHRRTVVTHNYHDYASAPTSELPQNCFDRKSKGGISSPFPSVLHHMLDQAEKEGFSKIVSWQPHGRAFHVHDQERFVSQVMPMFFRQTRFSSFQRQLSLYGFLRLTRKGSDHGAYYHEMCLRGMPHLSHTIQRRRVKGYWVRQSSSPDTEPDFFSMPAVGASAPCCEDKMAELTYPPNASTMHMIPSSAPAEGYIWDFMKVSHPQALPQKNQVPAGCMKMPPMPPLRNSKPLEMQGQSVVQTQMAGNMSRAVVPPPGFPSFTSSICMDTPAPLPAYSRAGTFPTTTKTIRSYSQAPEGTQTALKFSPIEQDIATFLTDVDLSSDCECTDDEAQAYKYEEELGRIFDDPIPL